MLTLSATSGRICLNLTASWIGCDLLVLLTGGKAHIGASALAEPDGSLKILGRSGHREAELAGQLARRIAVRLGCAVAASCGIHYDAITRAEISAVFVLTRNLTDKLLTKLEGNAMLTLSELDSFEKYIKSGRLETEFHASDEKRRHEILELLEKLMDVAELADEAATRIIFRGLKVPGPKEQ